jgi:hypothetical protein
MPHSVSIASSRPQNPVSPCFPAETRVPPPIAQKTRDSPTTVSMSISDRRGHTQISPCQIRTALREMCVQPTQILAFSDTPPPVLLELTHFARPLNRLFFRRCRLLIRRRERSTVQFGPNPGKSRGPQFETRRNIQAWHHAEKLTISGNWVVYAGYQYRKEIGKVPEKSRKSPTFIHEQPTRLLGLLW